jgi:ribosomal-protein-alanine N-acetyltransferase
VSGDASSEAIRVAVARAPLRLQTPRLQLRPFTLDDAGDIQRFAGDYDVARMTTTIPHPYEDGMAEEWIGTHSGERERGDGLVWAIEPQAASGLAGAIGVTVKPEREAAELGYWIAKPAWGQGYATEAARAVIACAFDDVGLHRVFARHFTDNPASGRVMQKAGMTYEGTLRHMFRRFGEWRDFAFYSILESEYQGQNAQGNVSNSRASGLASPE